MESVSVGYDVRVKVALGKGSVSGMTLLVKVENSTEV